MVAPSKEASAPLAAEDGVQPAMDSAGKKRKGAKERRNQETRRAGLDKVNRGLGFHYAGMVVFLLAQWAVWIAIGLVVVVARAPALDEMLLGVVETLLLAGGVLTLAAAVIDVPCPFLCLFVPDGQGRGLLAASLLMRPLVVLGGYFLWQGDQSRTVVLVLMFFATALAWVLWMFFVRRLCRITKDREMRRETIRVLISGFLTIVMIALTLVGLAFFVALLLSTQSVMGRAILLGFVLALLCALITALSKSPAVDSVLMAVLYPTGIPFFLRYLSLVASLRMELLRRG